MIQMEYGISSRKNVEGRMRQPMQKESITASVVVFIKQPVDSC